MKIQGSVEIQVRDSRTGKLKQTIKQDNLITYTAHSWLLTWGVRGIFNGFGISGNGYDTNIFISSSQATPNPAVNPTGILAVAYTPSGVTKATFNESTRPIFGQIQGRIDFTGTARTFYTVGLREARENTIHAYLLLDTPCVQGAFDYLDIFYRVQFLNTAGQGLPEQALIDFGRASFGFTSFDMSRYWTSVCTAPSNIYPYELFNFTEDLGTSFDLFFNRIGQGSISGTQVFSHFKFRMAYSCDLNSLVGLIFNSILQGRSGTGRGVYTCKKIDNPSSPFQNLFSHSADATAPFFDSLKLASGNGKIFLSGTWENKFPEFYKIIIVAPDVTGIATYKWSFRRHLGFNGNVYSDRAVGCPFRNPSMPAFQGMHGWRDENNDVLQYAVSQIVQYDDTGVTLLDVLDGSYQSWDSESLPELPVTQVRQVAVDLINKQIYVACRLTGLWVIDEIEDTVTQIKNVPCYGVDVGRNAIAFALFEGGLYSSSDWTTPLDFSYVGISDNNWSKVYFLKADPEHLDDRMALMMQPPTANNRRVVWHQIAPKPPIPSGEFKFDFPGDANGVAYWLGTNYGTSAWSNPHTAGRAIVVMSSVGQGTHEFMVNRIGGQNNHTNSVANSWISIDVGSGNTLTPNSYALQQRGVDGGYSIRNWKLQGSNNAASNSVADLNAASWTDLDIRVNDTSMGGIDAWASYTANATMGYRWLRILQTGVNSSGDNYLILGEFEFYGIFNSTTPARIPPARPLPLTYIGAESSHFKRWAASFDVSDTGGFWATASPATINGILKLFFGGAITANLGSNVSNQTVVHSLWGSDRYFKIAFYKNFLITSDRIINDVGVLQNYYAYLGERTFAIHLDGGIVLTNREMRQLFTDNSYCWDNYGWNGTDWELNHPSAKITHTTNEILGNGITVRFENGVNAPQFAAQDYYTQGVCNGVLKDNATSLYYESAWYSKPAQFDYPVQAGAVVPTTPFMAPTTTKYWRVRSKVAATGSDRRWYLRELIFRDSAGTDITSGGTVSVSHPSSSYPTINAVDKLTNQIVKVSEQETGWIAYTFATDVTVNRVSINNYNDLYYNIPPTSYVVESSTDGIFWAELWQFTTGIADSTYYNSTYDPLNNAIPSIYLLQLSASDDPNFIRMETDSPELIKLTIDGQPPSTVYIGGNIPPGINEIRVDINGSGLIEFNSADSGKAVGGVYSYIKN